MGLGIDIDGENVAILLYADDALLVCENEEDLQMLLETLHAWWEGNKLTVNHDESKVVHFRPQSVQLTQHILMSHVMRKPAFCICENKDADQLCGNRTADRRFCFRYIDSTIPLLSK